MQKVKKGRKVKEKKVMTTRMTKYEDDIFFYFIMNYIFGFMCCFGYFLFFSVQFIL